MISIPLKLLYDTIGHSITVELLECSLTGRLSNFDDYYNLTLEDCIYKGNNKRIIEVDKIFIRGNNIKYIILPQVMKYSSVLKLL